MLSTFMCFNSAWFKIKSQEKSLLTVYSAFTLCQAGTRTKYLAQCFTHLYGTDIKKCIKANNSHKLRDDHTYPNDPDQLVPCTALNDI